MSMISASLETSVSRDCFLTFPRKVEKSFQANKDGVVVLKLEWNNHSAYLSGKLSVVHELAPRMKMNKHPYFREEGGLAVTLDSTFANILGITRGSQVVVSQERKDIPHCISVNFGIKGEDEEILAAHKVKLESDLLNRIRIVYPGEQFPIWYDSYKGYITVQVLQTVPPCAQDFCILLVNSTVVNFQVLHRSTTTPVPSESQVSSSHEKSPTPSMEEEENSSVVTDSSDSSVTTKNKPTFSIWNIMPKLTKTDDQDMVDPMKLKEPETPLNPIMSFINYFMATGEQSSARPHSVTGGHSPERSYGSLERKQIPRNANGPEPRNKAFTHKKQPSLPVSLEGLERKMTAIPINTPPLSLYIRVQPKAGIPHSATNVGCKLCLEGRLPGEVEVMVHPDTLPQVYFDVLLAWSKHKTSPVRHYVALIPVVLPANEYEEEADDKKKDGSLPDSKKTEPAKSIVVRLKIQKSLHPINPVPGDEFFNEGPFYTESSVDSECSDVEDSVVDNVHQKRLSQQAECAGIKPGHVVLSNTVRRQLGVGIFSKVLMLDVQEREQVVCSKLVLLPLMPTKISAKQIKRSFVEWFFGASKSELDGDIPLTDGMVVPLVLEKEEEIPFRVKLEWKKDPLSSRVEIPKFAILSHFDLDKIPIHVEKKNSHTVEDKKRFWSNLEGLDPPLSVKKLKPLGAFQRVISECTTYLKNSFMKHLNQQQVGMVRSPGEGLLICGVGEYASGCGRTSLAHHLCQSLISHPTLVHCVEVSGTELRNRRGTSVRRILNGAMIEAVARQPSILLMDNLDHICCNPVTLEEDINGEAPLSSRAAEYLVDMLHAARKGGATVTFIGISRNKSTLNPVLLNVKGGNQLFGKIVKLPPPNLTERLEIFNTCFTTRGVHNCCTSVEKREIARRMEGYNIEDMVRLLDRAIYAAEYKSLGKWKKKGISPFVPLAHSHTERKSSHPDVRTILEGDRDTRADSVATLVDYSRTRVPLTLEDFLDAFEGYAPVALRGVPLQKPTRADFSHVGGMVEAKKTLVEYIHWPSKFPKLFSSLPLKQRCGILLYGPSGTGKTLLAQSIATEFGINYISVKGPELLDKFIGASEQKVRDIFVKAQVAQPCVLFFDEFESLVPRRGHDNTGVTDRVVNQFLTQLDGIERISGVYVVAASSRPDLIDPALLRPGRIDKKIYCAPPDKTEMVDILESLLRYNPTLNLAPEVGKNLTKLVEMCDRFTGADLKALLYNAQLELVHELRDKRRPTEMSPQSPVFEGVESPEHGQVSPNGVNHLEVLPEEEEEGKSLSVEKVVDLEETLVPMKSISTPNSPRHNNTHPTSTSQAEGISLPTARPQSLPRSLSEPYAKNQLKNKLHRKIHLPLHGYFCPPHSVNMFSTEFKGEQTKMKIESIRAKQDIASIQLKKSFSLTPQMSTNTTPGLPSFSRPNTVTKEGAHDGQQPQKYTLEWRHFLSALESTTPSLSESERLQYEVMRAKFENRIKETVSDYRQQITSHS